MADGSDLPATGGDTASAPPGAVTTSPEYAPLPPGEPEAYQPLSMLAIAAFGVAALYAGIVVIGGLSAMLTQTRWLWPLWTLVMPILAAGMGYLAHIQIRRSEGTQGGLKVASWAIGLSLSIGVIYGMYYLGTFFAVRAQAQSFADVWLKKIADGKIAEAFFETTKPPRKIRRAPEDADDAAALRRTARAGLQHGARPWPWAIFGVLRTRIRPVAANRRIESEDRSDRREGLGLRKRRVHGHAGLSGDYRPRHDPPPGQSPRRRRAATTADDSGK